MPNGSEAPRRVDRRRATDARGEPLFPDEARIFLLERDLDDHDDDIKEIRAEMKTLRQTVTSRLNWLVGLGFALLLSVVSVLVTVIASR